MLEMVRQLRAIGQLQRHLLPRVIPERPGWRLAVHYAVGRWPGGDYYDFLSLPDGRLGLFVADGSDEGAPSTTLVAMTRVVLHSCPLSSGINRLPFCPVQDPVIQSPHILLGHLNSVLAENSLAEQFLTAFCGVLDPIDGDFHYANASHPVPRWYRASRGRVEPLQDTAGLPLGVDAHSAYHHRRIQIEPGDVLVLYSDGIIAALNDRGQMFGSDRLDQAIEDAARHRAESVKAAVLDRLGEFVGDADYQDDVTLVVVQRLPS